MARVMIEEILDYLGQDFREVVKMKIDQCLPNNTISEYELLREFKGAVLQRFGIWLTVPDNYVEKQ